VQENNVSQCILNPTLQAFDGENCKTAEKTLAYLEGLKAVTGNLGCVWQVEGSRLVGICPSVKKSARSICLSDGRPFGSSVRRQQMRSRAVIETYGGMVNLLLTIRMYVSFSVDVSNGGRPHNSAYLQYSGWGQHRL